MGDTDDSLLADRRAWASRANEGVSGSHATNVGDTETLEHGEEAVGLFLVGV